MSTGEMPYRIEDDVELLADRYLRETVRDPDARRSGEPALLSKRQVAALIRDAYIAGYTKRHTKTGEQS